MTEEINNLEKILDEKKDDIYWYVRYTCGNETLEELSKLTGISKQGLSSKFLAMKDRISSKLSVLSKLESLVTEREKLIQKISQLDKSSDSTVLSRLISDTEAPLALKKLLQKHGFSTLGDLVEKSETELLSYRSISTVKVSLIKDMLKEYNLYLRA